MSYITLEGWFSAINGYHFILFNHFCHQYKVSFSFYLLASLESGIKDHKINPKNLVLHVGLILLITDYAKDFVVPKQPKRDPKGKQTKLALEYEAVSEEELVSQKGEKKKEVLEESESKEDVDCVLDSQDSIEVYSQPPALAKSGKGNFVLDARDYKTCSEEGVRDKPCKIGPISSFTILKEMIDVAKGFESYAPLYQGLRKRRV